MKKTTLILFLLSIALIQITALNFIKFFGAKPDLLLITVVFFALRFGPNSGFWVGLLCGLLEDALSGLPLGSATLAFSFCGLIIGALGKDIYRDSKFVQTMIVFICCIISYMSYYNILRIRSDVVLLQMPFSKILISSLYTSGISPFAILILNRLTLYLNKRFA